MAPRNNAAITRGRPFEVGNPGRPRGARHRTTIAIETLLEGQHEALTQKAIEMALGGDITALKLCLDRLAPPRRDCPVKIDLPAVGSAADTMAASTATIDALAEGTITPAEAGAIMAVLTAHLKFVETLELEQRLQALESRAGVGWE